MVKLYVKKILNGDINPATGEPWCVDDVPALWREQVREIIESND